MEDKVNIHLILYLYIFYEKNKVYLVYPKGEHGWFIMEFLYVNRKQVIVWSKKLNFFEK